MKCEHLGSKCVVSFLFYFLQMPKRKLKIHLFMVSLEKYVFSVSTGHQQCVFETLIDYNYFPCVSLCGILASTSSVDYESLRIGGLAFAVVLFTLGILLILSKLTSVCVCASFYYAYMHAMWSSVTITLKIINNKLINHYCISTSCYYTMWYW